MAGVEVSPVGLLSFALLGVSVVVHIVLVSATIGLGLITAVYRHLSYTRRDPVYERLARRYFRAMVVSELFSGVWGTIITVFLAGLFPGLTALATNVLFVPIAVAVSSILVRIPSIAIFWYTWDRVSPATHTVIGWVMALSGLGVPLGFRTIFAETMSPHAVLEFLERGSVGILTPFTSQVYIVLYLHTIVAAVSVGGFLVASLGAVYRDARDVYTGLVFGYGALLVQIAAGPLYWYTLREYSPHVFETATFGLLAPVLVLKMVLVTTLLVLGSYSLARAREGRIHPAAQWLGVLALAVVALGETVNDGSRYPYIVVTGEKGIPIDQYINYFMEIPLPAVYVIVFFLLIGVVVFLTAFYYAIFRWTIPETPEEVSETTETLR